MKLRLTILLIELLNTHTENNFKDRFNTYPFFYFWPGKDKDINKKSKIKTTDGEAMILNRKEVVKVIKDLQSFLFPDYYTHSEGSENVLSQTELLLNIYNRLAKVIKGACEFNGTDLVCSPEIICEKFIKKEPDTIADVGILYAISISVDLLSRY